MASYYQGLAKFVGKRVQLRPAHPHAGEYAVVERLVRLGNAEGLEVRLEDCPHGTQRCGVFTPRHLRVVRQGAGHGGV